MKQCFEESNLQVIHIMIDLYRNSWNQEQEKNFMENNNTNQDAKSKKINAKMILAIASFILIFSAAVNRFITIYNDNGITSAELRVRGVELIIFSLIYYIGSIAMKKKKAYYLFGIIVFLSYCYGIYTYIDLINALKYAPEYITGKIQMGEGVYLYFASFILFIISIIIPIKFDNPNKPKRLAKEVEQERGIENQYILANYIFGLNKRPDLYYKLATIINKEESENLEIEIQSEQLERILIPKNNIKDVTQKLAIISKEVMETWNYKPSEYLFDFQIDPKYAFIKSAVYKDKVYDYYKMKTDTVYDIQIIYEIEEQEHKLMFQTKFSPSDFLNKLKEELKNTNKN